jgi:phage terminase large subunit
VTQAQVAPLFELWPIQQELFGMFGLDPDAPTSEPAEEILFGGQVGGSKSFAGRALCLFLALEYWPGSRGFICRRTFPEVYSTHVIPLLQQVPGLANGTLGKYNATTHQFLFFNGSILDLIHCAEDADAMKYLSFEWDYGFFDEATQLTELQYSLLRSRVRSSKPGWRRIVLACSNPGGNSHTYFKEHFVDPAAPRTIFMGMDGDPPRTSWRRAFLPSTLADNPSLSEEDVRAGVMAIPDPIIRKAHAEGNWNIAADQVFSEWDPHLHTCAPFTVPPEWTRWCGLDYGYADPTCCLWMARVPAGEPIPTRNPALQVSDRPRVVVYRELYQAKLYPQLQALRIRQLSAGERIGAVWADQSMFRRAPGQNYAAEYRAGGLSIQPCNSRDIRLGVARIHRALEGHDLWPPELLVFDTCWNLIRDLPALPRDKNDPEKFDQGASAHKYTHGPDALRYGLLGGTRRKVLEAQTYRVVA